MTIFVCSEKALKNLTKYPSFSGNLRIYELLIIRIFHKLCHAYRIFWTFFEPLTPILVSNIQLSQNHQHVITLVPLKITHNSTNHRTALKSSLLSCAVTKGSFITEDVLVLVRSPIFANILLSTFPSIYEYNFFLKKATF